MKKITWEQNKNEVTARGKCTTEKMSSPIFPGVA